MVHKQKRFLDLPEWKRAIIQMNRAIKILQDSKRMVRQTKNIAGAGWNYENAINYIKSAKTGKLPK